MANEQKEKDNPELSWILDTRCWCASTGSVSIWYSAYSLQERQVIFLRSKTDGGIIHMFKCLNVYLSRPMTGTGRMYILLWKGDDTNNSSADISASVKLFCFSFDWLWLKHKHMCRTTWYLLHLEHLWRTCVVVRNGHFTDLQFLFFFFSFFSP